MDIIQNTEAMPITPQGARGYWEWDADTTARHRSTDGQEWLLKGAWRWRQTVQRQDAFTKNATVKQIVQFHKPIRKEIETKSFAAEKAGKALLVVTGIIMALTAVAILSI